MTDIDEALAANPPQPEPARSTVAAKPAPRPKDPMKVRQGRQARNYGNRAELDAARRYGGVKVGHGGGPVDIRGIDFQTQMKTHRRKPPVEWKTAIGAMPADGRCPRLLVRFVQPTGPEDFFVFRAADFLAWFGRDEEETDVR